MCGINGIYTKDSVTGKKISLMNRFIRHRGPDDEGFAVFNSDTGKYLQLSGDDTVSSLKARFPDINLAKLDDFDLFFGHRRLSIIDLSEHGHGPMPDVENKFWITYNGEIYNYIELRDELRSLGHKFNTESDTEVILNSYKQWGAGCLNKFNGMWAFAIWDIHERSLFIARDRFGVKPLYYISNPEVFAFSSEIKALLKLRNSAAEINSEKIPFYLLYGNRLNSEETYYRDIFSLKPSTYLTFKNGSVSISEYYDINRVDLAERSENELKDSLVDLLEDSIRLRFRSDVPVGTCLSGGFDSSSIVAFSSGVTGKGLNTFSAVWQDPKCDESKYIDIVNSKFDCAENKIEPSADEFEKVFDELNYYQEIPTEGPGLYPQWYVMKKAKEKVKVLLDGQGGDEVFGGYFMLGTYLRALIEDGEYPSILFDMKQYFKFLRSNGIHGFSSWIFPKTYNKLVRGILSDKSGLLKKELVPQKNRKQLYLDNEPARKFDSYINDVSYHFIKNITIPALLHYEDRSSMAHSIESRVPFLDYRLVEFGVNLPKKHLAYKGTSRPLYRKALAPFLPAEIVNRTDKLGYPTPFTVWTRNNLRNYVQDILGSQSAYLYDFVDKHHLNKVLGEHFDGIKDYGWEIWRLLSLEKFLQFEKSERFVSQT